MPTVSRPFQGSDTDQWGAKLDAWLDAALPVFLVDEQPGAAPQDQVTSALNLAAAAGGGIVQCSAHPYVFTDRLYWPTNGHNVTLRGVRGKTQIVPAGGPPTYMNWNAGWEGMIEIRNTGAFANQPNNPVIDGISIEDIIFDALWFPTVAPLIVHGVSNFKLRRCRFTHVDQQGNGVALGFLAGSTTSSGDAGPNTHVLIENCAFDDMKAYAIIFYGGNNIAGQPVTYIPYNNDFEIKGCYFNKLLYGGIVSGMSNFRQVANFNIHDNYFENGGFYGTTNQSGYIYDANKAGTVNWEIHHNYFGKVWETACGGVGDHGGWGFDVHHNRFELDNDEIWPIAIGDSRTLFPYDDWGALCKIEDNFFYRCAAFDYDSQTEVSVRRNVFYRGYGRPLGAFGHKERHYIEDNWFIECGQVGPTNATLAEYGKAGVSGGLGMVYRRNTFVDKQTVRAAVAIQPAGANNDLYFVAERSGIGGNSIRVRYVDPGAVNAVLSVTRSNLDVTVNLATNGAGAITSTAKQVRDAVNTSDAVKYLLHVRYYSTDNGTGVVTAMGFTTLTGGSDVTPAKTQIYGVWMDVGDPLEGRGAIEFEDNDWTDTPTPIYNGAAGTAYPLNFGKGLNVLHFGAKLDGTTDDSAARTRALNTAKLGLAGSQAKVFGYPTYGTAASAATVTILPGWEVVNVTGTTAITALAGGYAGQRVTLIFAGVLTVTNGATLKLSGGVNFATTANDALTLVCDGTNWYETGRSVN